MIKRKYNSKINWINLEKDIVNETTTIKWYFCGILIRTRIVEVQNLIVGDEKKLGFGK